MHPGLLASEPLPQLVRMGPQRIGLGGGVATVGVDALQTVGGGGEAAVVLVELTGERGLRLAGFVEQGAGAMEARLGVVGRDGGGVGPFAGLLQRGAGGTGRGRADPPTRGAEAPAGAGDDDRVGVGEGRVDRRRPATVHGHGPAEERVEQRLHVGSTGPDVGADRLADARCRCRRAVSAEGQDRPADGVVAFGVEGADRRPSRVDAVDDDRRERLARRRLDGRLPAGVDLDEVEQRADDSVDGCQALGAGPSAGLVEGEAEGLGACGPRVTIAVGRPERGLGLGDPILGRGAVLLGRPEALDERSLRLLGGGGLVAQPSCFGVQPSELLLQRGEPGLGLGRAPASPRSTPDRSAASSPRPSAARPVGAGIPSAQSRSKPTRASASAA